jgi:hypothetical protein
MIKIKKYLGHLNLIESKNICLWKIILIKHKKIMVIFHLISLKIEKYSQILIKFIYK